MAKQVIVLRKDLNMRKGKMVAQGAHASLAAFLNLGCTFEMESDDGPTERNFEVDLMPWPAVWEWVRGTFTKICVSVNSEAELLAIQEKAHAAGLPSSLIKDNGLTEFNGVHTYTAVAVGPGPEEEIDKITGHLPLL